MRLMIDTNIILDVLLEREPFFAHSKAVLEMCEKKQIHGFISASTATDIFYLIRKGLGSTEEAYRALGHILDIVKVLTVTNDDVNHAFLQKARDFEDCLLATCAKSNKWVREGRFLPVHFDCKSMLCLNKLLTIYIL